MSACRLISIVLWMCLLFQYVEVTTAENMCVGKASDVIFLVDASTSVWGPDFATQLVFIQDIIGDFDIRPRGTRCALITFSDYTRVEFNLRSFQNGLDMRYAVTRAAQLYGSTRTDLALLRMYNMYEEQGRRGLPKLVILLTDGESEYGDETTKAAELVHQAGITVFTIGVGENTNKEELGRIASSADDVFGVDTFDELQSIRSAIAMKVCEMQSGNQQELVPVTPPTKGCDGKPADIVFALDSSSSIWGEDYMKQMQFVKDIITIFEVSDSATRVGLLTFGDRVTRHFYLHKYTNTEKLIKAIGRVRQSTGNTNTAGALHSLRKQFFSPRRARDGVVHIGIVITDGQSDDPKETARQARLARKDGIQLFAIGVGHNVDQRELYKIASEPGDQYVFEVNTYEALGSIKNLLAMKTCEVPEPPTTRPPPPPPMGLSAGCSSQLPADIIFALPPDSTTTESNEVLRFIRNVTGKLDLDSDAVRFGLLPKHCYTIPGFDLRTGSGDRNNVISMISSSYFQPMSAENVIKHMCDISFKPIKGSRQNSKKIGVVFVNTDMGSEYLSKSAEEATRAQKDHGVDVMIIGVGNGVTEEELVDLVNPPMNKNIMIVPNYGDLRNIAAAMTNRFHDLCMEPVFEFYKL